jgi:hypothetical protein
MEEAVVVVGDAFSRAIQADLIWVIEATTVVWVVMIPVLVEVWVDQVACLEWVITVEEVTQDMAELALLDMVRILCTVVSVQSDTVS